MTSELRMRREADAGRRMRRRLAPLGPGAEALRFDPTPDWLRLARVASGLSRADIAAVLDISQGSLARIEASELREAIRIDTLRHAADALGCDLVYVLLPRSPAAFSEAGRRERRRERWARRAEAALRRAEAWARSGSATRTVEGA